MQLLHAAPASMDHVKNDLAAVVDQKWTSKSSSWFLIGFVSLIALLSFAALRLSTPTNTLFYASLLSPRSPAHAAHDLQSQSINQTVENHDVAVQNASKSQEQPVESRDGGVDQIDESKCKEQPQETEEISLYERNLMEVFERAAMPSKTVILTTLNAAWAEDNTMIDMFLESFWHGDGTRKLLEHLVIVCVDEKAHQRCLVIHPHCLFIKTDGVDFTGQKLLLSADFIKMMWRRIEFLGEVLAMNYSFIFTDTDVLWFRNPFPLLQSDTEADFQIACDEYTGNPGDINNSPNTGFMYVRPNARTVQLFAYWFEQRKRDPLMADQGMLNAIKYDEDFNRIGLKLRFIDTKYLGGFCGLKTTDMTKALTMHATCCKGLAAKLKDLRMMLDGWKAWHAQSVALPIPTRPRRKRQKRAKVPGVAPENANPSDPRFKTPSACIQSWHIDKP